MMVDILGKELERMVTSTYVTSVSVNLPERGSNEFNKVYPAAAAARPIEDIIFKHVLHDPL
ncbi:MAG TPA: hypothetical protein VE223_03860 [Nitrososphaeraceae archaeon]|nr:hypothetical protein [Nitrososphaeraceae archaeon]